MAFANTVKFTAGSTGTSDFADGTAATGFRNLAGGAVSGQAYSYRAVSADLSQWENGHGVYNGTTLARTTIFESSTGSKVSFTAAPIVFLTPLRADLDGSSRIVAVWTPQSNQPPASNYATLGLRNSEPTLLFDTTTQEAAVFGGVLPSNYGGNGLKVTIWASLVSATSGTLGWDGAFETLNGQDTDSDGFATAKTFTAATVPATSGQPMSHTVTFSNSEIDGMVGGDPFRFRLRRDVANDTASGDAEFIRAVAEMV